MNKTLVIVLFMVRMITIRLSGFTYVLAQIFRGQSGFIPFASLEELVIENKGARRRSEEKKEGRRAGRRAGGIFIKYGDGLMVVMKSYTAECLEKRALGAPK